MGWMSGPETTSFAGTGGGSGAGAGGGSGCCCATVSAVSATGATSAVGDHISCGASTGSGGGAAAATSRATGSGAGGAVSAISGTGGAVTGRSGAGGGPASIGTGLAREGDRLGGVGRCCGSVRRRRRRCGYSVLRPARRVPVPAQHERPRRQRPGLDCRATVGTIESGWLANQHQRVSSNGPMRRLPARAAAGTTPASGRPARRRGVQFGLLHHVEYVEQVAAAEWIGRVGPA